MDGGQRKQDSQKDYFQTIIRKYEDRNAQFRERQCDLRHRLEAIECSMPALMCFNMLQARNRPPINDECDNDPVKETPNKISPSSNRNVRNPRNDVNLHGCDCNPCPLDPNYESALRSSRTAHKPNVNARNDLNMQDCRCNPCPIDQSTQERNIPLQNAFTSTASTAINTRPISPAHENMSTVDDMQYMAKIKELAENEKKLREEIEELEHKERAYTETLKQSDDWSSETNRNGAGDYEIQTLRRMNQEIEFSNKALEEELEEVKRELKHIQDTIEAPIRKEIENEKNRCINLEEQLNRHSADVSNREATHRKKVEFLERQLQSANRNLNDLHVINKRLKEELCMLNCRCNELQNDLINQKISEIHTVSRMTAKKEKIYQPPLPKPVFSLSDTGSSDDLNAIARNLSNLLREATACNNCKQTHPDLIDTVQYIKDLVDIVNTDKKTSNLSDLVCECVDLQKLRNVIGTEEGPDDQTFEIFSPHKIPSMASTISTDETKPATPLKLITPKVSVAIRSKKSERSVDAPKISVEATKSVGDKIPSKIPSGVGDQKKKLSEEIETKIEVTEAVADLFTSPSVTEQLITESELLTDVSEVESEKEDLPEETAGVDEEGKAHDVDEKGDVPVEIPGDEDKKYTEEAARGFLVDSGSEDSQESIEESEKLEGGKEEAKSEEKEGIESEEKEGIEPEEKERPETEEKEEIELERKGEPESEEKEEPESEEKEEPEAEEKEETEPEEKEEGSTLEEIEEEPKSEEEDIPKPIEGTTTPIDKSESEAEADVAHILKEIEESVSEITGEGPIEKHPSTGKEIAKDILRTVCTCIPAEELKLCECPPEMKRPAGSQGIVSSKPSEPTSEKPSVKSLSKESIEKTSSKASSKASKPASEVSSTKTSVKEAESEVSPKGSKPASEVSSAKDIAEEPEISPKESKSPSKVSSKKSSIKDIDEEPEASPPRSKPTSKQESEKSIPEEGEPAAVPDVESKPSVKSPQKSLSSKEASVKSLSKEEISEPPSRSKPTSKEPSERSLSKEGISEPSSRSKPTSKEPSERSLSKEGISEPSSRSKPTSKEPSVEDMSKGESTARKVISQEGSKRSLPKDGVPDISMKAEHSSITDRTPKELSEKFLGQEPSIEKLTSEEPSKKSLPKEDLPESDVHLKRSKASSEQPSPKSSSAQEIKGAVAKPLSAPSSKEASQKSLPRKESSKTSQSQTAVAKVISVKPEKENRLIADIEAEGDIPVEAEIEVTTSPTSRTSESLYVTTAVTSSGHVEVTTEGPTGVVETKIKVTESGNVEVITGLKEFDKSSQENIEELESDYSKGSPVVEVLHAPTGDLKESQDAFDTEISKPSVDEYFVPTQDQITESAKVSLGVITEEEDATDLKAKEKFDREVECQCSMGKESEAIQIIREKELPTIQARRKIDQEIQCQCGVYKETETITEIVEKREVAVDKNEPPPGKRYCECPPPVTECECGKGEGEESEEDEESKDDIEETTHALVIIKEVPSEPKVEQTDQRMDHIKSVEIVEEITMKKICRKEDEDDDDEVKSGSTVSDISLFDDLDMDASSQPQDRDIFPADSIDEVAREGSQIKYPKRTSKSILKNPESSVVDPRHFFENKIRMTAAVTTSTADLSYSTCFCEEKDKQKEKEKEIQTFGMEEKADNTQSFPKSAPEDRFGNTTVNNLKIIICNRDNCKTYTDDEESVVKVPKCECTKADQRQQSNVCNAKNCGKFGKNQQNIPSKRKSAENKLLLENATCTTCDKTSCQVIKSGSHYVSDDTIDSEDVYICPDTCPSIAVQHTPKRVCPKSCDDVRTAGKENTFNQKKSKSYSHTVCSSTCSSFGVQKDDSNRHQNQGVCAPGCINVGTQKTSHPKRSIKSHSTNTPKSNKVCTPEVCESTISGQRTVSTYYSCVPFESAREPNEPTSLQTPPVQKKEKLSPTQKRVCDTGTCMPSSPQKRSCDPAICKKRESKTQSPSQKRVCNTGTCMEDSLTGSDLQDVQENICDPALCKKGESKIASPTQKRVCDTGTCMQDSPRQLPDVQKQICDPALCKKGSPRIVSPTEKRICDSGTCMEDSPSARQSPDVQKQICDPAACKKESSRTVSPTEKPTSVPSSHKKPTCDPEKCKERLKLSLKESESSDALMKTACTSLTCSTMHLDAITARKASSPASSKPSKASKPSNVPSDERSIPEVPVKDKMSARSKVDSVFSEQEGITSEPSKLSSPETDKKSSLRSSGSKLTSPSSDRKSSGRSSTSKLTSPEGDKKSSARSSTSKLISPETDKKSSARSSGSKLTSPSSDRKSSGRSSTSKLTSPEGDKKSSARSSTSKLISPETDKKSSARSSGSKLTSPSSDRKSSARSSASKLTSPEGDKKSSARSSGSKLSSPESDKKPGSGKLSSASRLTSDGSDTKSSVPSASSKQKSGISSPRTVSSTASSQKGKSRRADLDISVICAAEESGEVEAPCHGEEIPEAKPSSYKSSDKSSTPSVTASKQSSIKSKQEKSIVIDEPIEKPTAQAEIFDTSISEIGDKSDVSKQYRKLSETDNHSRSKSVSIDEESKQYREEEKSSSKISTTSSGAKSPTKDLSRHPESSLYEEVTGVVDYKEGKLSEKSSKISDEGDKMSPKKSGESEPSEKKVSEKSSRESKEMSKKSSASEESEGRKEAPSRKSSESEPSEKKVSERSSRESKEMSKKSSASEESEGRKEVPSKKSSESSEGEASKGSSKESKEDMEGSEEKLTKESGSADEKESKTSKESSTASSKSSASAQEKSPPVASKTSIEGDGEKISKPKEPPDKGSKASLHSTDSEKRSKSKIPLPVAKTSSQRKELHQGDCACVLCLTEEGKTLEHPPDCDCVDCLCDPNKFGKRMAEITEEEPSEQRSETQHTLSCTCIDCLYEPQRTLSKSSEGQKPSILEEPKHSPSCECIDCLCVPSDTTIPVTVERPKGTVYVCPSIPPVKSKHHPDCKCRKCVCDPCGHRPDCTCKLCKCDPCKDEIVEFKKHPPECSCPDCICDPCGDADMERKKEMQALAKQEETVFVCPSLPPQKSKRHPDCKCPECICDPCNRQPDCSCKLCKCDPCKDEIVQFEKHPPDCTCPDCICAPCGDKNIENKKEMTKHPPDCDCAECICEPCTDEKVQREKEAKHPKDCNCATCICDPCNDEKIQAQKEPPPPPERHIEDGDCTCEECLCDPCDDPKVKPPKSCKDCGCIICICDPCEDPRVAASRKPHPPSCNCVECLCNPCNDKTKIRPHPPGCTCRGCICNPCKSTAKQHGPNCRCPTCVCDPCSDIESKKSVHGPDCTCVKCICAPCERKADAKEKHGPNCKCSICKRKHGPTCDCPTCLCDPCSDPERKKSVHGPDCTCVKCICAPCERKADARKHGPNCNCSICKPSEKPKPIELTETHGPNCKCKPCKRKRKSAAKSQEKDLPKIPEECPECDCSPICVCDNCPALRNNTAPSAKAMKNEALQKNIKDMEKENARRENDMKELKGLMSQIRCACEDAEKQAIRTVPPEPKLMQKASTFRNTLSGLQLAMNTLEEKCRVKDKMIDAMTQELRLRANSNVFSEMLRNMAGYPPVDVDFDRHEVCDSLPRPIDDPRYGRPSYRYVDTVPELSCICNDVPVSMKITSVKQISPNSILIKWTQPASDQVLGYEVSINNVLKSRIHSAQRTSTVVFAVNVKTKLNISVYAVTQYGRCEPPATCTYGS